ncbi:MAG: hypothetical protein KKG59_01995, partial [Nanoarchaeota archaeon]|nr:hypothetical protein [Nanoarchaeota archaeon]
EEKFKVYLDNENEIREISLLEITKKSPLTRLEKAMARGHVATGQKKLMYKAPKIIEMIAMLHSENYNGTGYLRYTQNMIRNVFNCPPEIINVVAVADEFDTKISRDYQLDRSHSAKSFYLDLGATIEHMQKCAIEETLNPAYVDAFLGLLQDDRSLTARTIRHMKERNG